MAHNRSFKEYVANRFYNELYAAIEETSTHRKQLLPSYRMFRSS